MRRENMSLFFGLVGLAVIIGIIYYFVAVPGPEQESPTSASVTPSMAQVPPNGSAQQPPGNMNPQYGNLTKDQIQQADIAVGKLLNSVQGLNPSMITVKSFEKKDFPDASLGCPQKGQMAAQVVTPGYNVVLEAQGKTYDYRFTDEKNIFECKQ